MEVADELDAMARPLLRIGFPEEGYAPDCPKVAVGPRCSPRSWNCNSLQNPAPGVERAV